MWVPDNVVVLSHRYFFNVLCVLILLCGYGRYFSTWYCSDGDQSTHANASGRAEGSCPEEELRGDHGGKISGVC